MRLDKQRALPIIKAALKEDIGNGDITTAALIERADSCEAEIVVNEDCVVCGLDAAEWAMAHVDFSVRFRPNCADGAFVGAGKEIAYLEGCAASILRAERTMLNFLSFLSAIATRTRKFADIAAPFGVKIMDTRKTIPLMRYLEKYAVTAGGGSNHRMGLYDRVLIKDSHLDVLRKSRMFTGAGQRSLKNIVERARKRSIKGVTVEIEVGSVDEFSQALEGRPDIIMLDNMSPKDVMACVDIRRFAKHKPLLEVSGGINMDTIAEFARTKVDMISIGSLTASVDSVDMSLEIL